MGTFSYAASTNSIRRTVIANVMDLCTQIIHKYHDIPVGGHLGRKNTFATVSRDFFRPHMYEWMCKWIRTCKICQ